MWGQSKKQLKAENDTLRLRVASLEARLAAYGAIEENLSGAGENENKESAAMEDVSSSSGLSRGSQDLHSWYLHRPSRYANREQYNMDSVRFTTDVPDSVLMRRLRDMNSFISLPYNETVKNYMILYSEKMPLSMGEVLGLSEY